MVKKLSLKNKTTNEWQIAVGPYNNTVVNQIQVYYQGILSVPCMHLALADSPHQQLFIHFRYSVEDRLNSSQHQWQLLSVWLTPSILNA